MGVSCIVSEMKRYIGRNFDFSYPSTTTSLEKTVTSIFALFFSQPSHITAHMRRCKYVLQNVFCLLTSQARYSQTDKQTEKNDLNSEAYYVTLVKSQLDPRGRECLCLASKSNFGLL